jgi:hypothetical protein
MCFAVGAFSLASPDFLVPLLLPAHIRPRISVLLGAFGKVDRAQRPVSKRATAVTVARHCSLPLPLLSSALESGSSQLFISPPDFTKESTRCVVSKWAYRISALVRSSGDKELARRIVSRSHRFASAVADEAFFDASCNQFCLAILRAAYRMLLDSYPPSVTPLTRSIPSLTGETSGVPKCVRALATVLASATHGKGFQGRRRVELEIGATRHAVKYAVRNNDSSFTLFCGATLQFSLIIDNNHILLYDSYGREMPPGTWSLIPYGVLTNIRLLEFGCPAHVPWYASFRLGPENDGLFAIEFVSPFSPIQRSRASSFVGGGVRLHPSGAFLLDYTGGDIYRFVSCVLGRTANDWLSIDVLRRVQECAYGGESRRRRERSARACTRAWLSLYEKAMGRGLHRTVTPSDEPLPPQMGVTFLHLVKSLAVLNLYRKIAHPQSVPFVRRSCVEFLKAMGFVHNSTLSISAIAEYINAGLNGVTVFYGYNPELKAKGARAISASNVWRSANCSGRRHWFGIMFPCPNEWKSLRLVQRALEDLLVEAILSLWRACGAALAANLPLLAVLLSPADLSQATTTLQSTRSNKCFVGSIHF